MKLACPSCQEYLTVDTVGPQLSTELGCTACDATVGITVTTSILQAGNGSTIKSPKRRAVVAIADRALRTAYAARLRDAGWQVRETEEGRETLQTMAQDVPDVAIIDGGMAPIFGMGLGEIIKKSNVTRSARVVGLRPDDDTLLPLPGADRTLVLTAGADEVLDAANRLAPERGPSITAPATPAIPTQTTSVAAISKPLATNAPKDEAIDPDHAAAQRLARIIVSDIALYNKAALDKGLQCGNLMAALSPLLDEGRAHFESRVSSQIRAQTDYFNAAVEHYVATRQVGNVAVA